MENLRPGSGVEELALGMRNRIPIPLRIGKRIEDLDLKRRADVSAACGLACCERYPAVVGVVRSTERGDQGGMKFVDFFQATTAAVTASRKLAATISICASLSSGNIGNDTNSRAVRSETGKSPTAYPRF